MKRQYNKQLQQKPIPCHNFPILCKAYNSQATMNSQLGRKPFRHLFMPVAKFLLELQKNKRKDGIVPVQVPPESSSDKAVGVHLLLHWPHNYCGHLIKGHYLSNLSLLWMAFVLLCSHSLFTKNLQKQRDKREKKNRNIRKHNHLGLSALAQAHHRVVGPSIE